MSDIKDQLIDNLIHRHWLEKQTNFSRSHLIYFFDNFSSINNLRGFYFNLFDCKIKNYFKNYFSVAN